MMPNTTEKATVTPITRAVKRRNGDDAALGDLGHRWRIGEDLKARDRSVGAVPAGVDRLAVLAVGELRVGLGVCAGSTAAGPRSPIMPTGENMVTASRR